MQSKLEKSGGGGMRAKQLERQPKVSASLRDRAESRPQRFPASPPLPPSARPSSLRLRLSVPPLLCIQRGEYYSNEDITSSTVPATPSAWTAAAIFSGHSDARPTPIAELCLVHPTRCIAHERGRYHRLWNSTSPHPTNQPLR